MLLQDSPDMPFDIMFVLFIYSKAVNNNVLGINLIGIEVTFLLTIVENVKSVLTESNFLNPYFPSPSVFLHFQIILKYSTSCNVSRNVISTGVINQLEALQ